MKTNIISNKTWMGAGILSAFAASLCCLTPLISFVAGISGIASAFSWLEPWAPIFSGVTILVLGFAWYQKLKPKKTDQIDCDCEEDEKPKFFQSKKFLTIVTIAAALLLTFPYYSHIFYPDSQASVFEADENNIEKVKLDIEGMTCTGCESHVNSLLAEIYGVIKYKTSFKNRNIVVKFDRSKTSIDEIINVVNETGYKITKISRQ